MSKKKLAASREDINRMVQEAREDRKRGLYDVYTREDHHRFIKKMLNKYGKKNN